MKCFLVFILAALPAFAEPSMIENVEAEQFGGTWRFNVTLSHPDTGWDHYADGWRVEAFDGTILGTRELLHPHVDEQPFTRSLSGISIPEGLSSVNVRAKCSKDGWSKEVISVPLN